jgi:uncharacterized protein
VVNIHQSSAFVHGRSKIKVSLIEAGIANVTKVTHQARSEFVPLPHNINLQMETLEILGYFAAILIGVSLGLIGGGGSILTVPVLVYLLNVSPVLATSYSLFTVGATALAGSLAYIKKGLVHYKTALIFSLPSFLGVYVTRRFILPALPDPVFTIGTFELTKDLGVMLFFAIIMLAAAWSMIRDKRPENGDMSTIQFNYPLIALEGLIVGVLTGMVGAGGGFLIIPALVLLAKLPMKMAVGTSLLIIAVKSLFGFLGDIGTQPINVPFMLIFTALALSGIFVGSALSNKIDGKKIKSGFGYFVLVMATYILIRELIL